MDLAYLQTGISGLFLGFELQKHVSFRGELIIDVVFWGACQIFAVSLSVFFFLTVHFGSSFIHQLTSVNTVLHYYHTVLNFYLRNLVLGGYWFMESFFGSFLSVAKCFLGLSEIPISDDPCM